MRPSHATLQVPAPGAKAGDSQYVLVNTITYIRIAPHWYTADDECEAIMDEIASLRVGAPA